MFAKGGFMSPCCSINITLWLTRWLLRRGGDYAVAQLFPHAPSFSSELSSSQSSFRAQPESRPIWRLSFQTAGSNTWHFREISPTSTSQRRPARRAEEFCTMQPWGFGEQWHLAVSWKLSWIEEGRNGSQLSHLDFGDGASSLPSTLCHPAWPAEGQLSHAHMRFGEGALLTIPSSSRLHQSQTSWDKQLLQPAQSWHSLGLLKF